MLLTSSNAESDRLHAYVKGAKSYLVKPVHVGAFVDLVQQLSFYRPHFNRPA